MSYLFVNKIMGESDIKSTKVIISIIISLMIFITLIMIFVIAFEDFRIKNDALCAYNRYTDYAGTPLSNGTVLNSADQYLLQQFEIIGTGDVNYQFCYDGFVVSDAGLSVNIIDENMTILGRDFLDNETTNHCTQILDIDLIRKKMYIGVQCLDCNSTNNFTLQKETLGDDVRQITNESVNVDKTLSYVLQGNRDCKHQIKFLMGWYFVTMVIMIGLILILVGYDKMLDSILFEDL